MREWLVIEATAGRSVFADDELRNRKGYIPRDVVEGQLGIKIDPDGRHTWFTREQGVAMRAHPEWSDTEPGVPPDNMLAGAPCRAVDFVKCRDPECQINKDWERQNQRYNFNYRQRPHAHPVKPEAA